MRTPSLVFGGAQRPPTPGKRTFTAGKLGQLSVAGVGGDALVGVMYQLFYRYGAQSK